MNTPQVEAYTGQGFSPDEVRRRCAEANLQGRMAERERCSRIAAETADCAGDRESMLTAQCIAEEIRKGD